MDDTKIDAYTTVVEGRPIILLNAEKNLAVGLGLI